MMKSEFIDLIKLKNHPRFDQEYLMIEYVYTWHPLNLSKEEAALLYEKFGVGIFRDMYKTAANAEQLETEAETARIAHENASIKFENFAGDYKR